MSNFIGTLKIVRQQTYQMSLFLASVRSAFKSSFWIALDACGERSFRNCKNAFAEFLVAKYLVFNFDLCLDITVLI